VFFFLGDNCWWWCCRMWMKNYNMTYMIVDCWCVEPIHDKRWCWMWWLHVYLETIIGDDEYLYLIIGDDLCEYMHCCWLISSCIHDWWWWILYPKWRRLWYFCCIKGDDLVGDWYHMHVGVMRRCIIWSCMSFDYMCAWWLVWLVNYLSVIFVNL